jgi:hypothetical protein
MRYLLTSVALALLVACSSSKQSSMTTVPNTLSEQEKEAGWQLLFDGQSTAGWHTYGKPGAVGKAWKVEDSTLRLDAAAKKDWQTAEGGDIVTDSEFDNFHLSLEWKIAPGGNSGIMFYVQEDTTRYPYPWSTGPEMQVLDNAAHADAKIEKHRAGDLYDLITSKETVKPAGQWNLAEIKSDKGKLQFFLNGEEVLSTTMWDNDWRALIAGSKFKDMPGFGTFQKGRIALQDHGDNVWFRNIKIRRL